MDPSQARKDRPVTALPDAGYAPCFANRRCICICGDPSKEDPALKYYLFLWRSTKHFILDAVHDYDLINCVTV